MAAVADVEVRVDARNATAQLNKLTNGVKSFAAQVGLAVGTVATLKKSLDAAFAREATENRLKSLVNSTKEYSLAINAAAIASKRFGVTQTQAQEALGTTLGRLKALGLNLGQVESIYTGFNVIAREARVSTEDASGAFLQLSQAMGSGTLQGDELRSILERMPQLAQAIAQSMGVGAESIKKLGSEGKIGLTEIKNALDTAAKRADNLDSTFTKQQATMALVRQRAEEVGVQLGKTLAPAFLTILDGMANAAFVLAAGFKATAEFATKNQELIKNIVNFGLRFAAVAGAVYLVVKAYKAWQVISKAVAATQAFIVGLTGPLGWGVILGAVGAATAAAFALDAAFDGVGDAINKAKEEGNKAFAEMKAQTLKELANLKLTGDQRLKNTQAVKDQTKALEAQAKTQLSAARQAQVALNREVDAAQNRSRLNDAYYDAELKLNALAIQRAKQKGKLGLVLKLEIQRAKIIYNQTLSQIKAEVERARLVARQVLLETKILKSKLLQKKAKKGLTQEDVDAYKAQLGALKTANKNVEVQTKVADQQIRGAKATYDASVSAAKFAYQQGKAAKAAKKTADEMARARRGGGDAYDDADFGTYEPKGYLDKMFSYDIFGNPVKRYTSKYGYTYKPRQMAEGGYVTRPTDAVIGEAGENEYVIPESKMGSAIRRYARGDRGASVVEGGSETSGSSRRSSGAVVNISTGPVMRMNNKNYVTVSDLNNAVGSVVAAMSESGSSSYGGGARLS